MKLIIKAERIAYKKKFTITGEVNHIEKASDKLIQIVLFRSYKILEKQLDGLINNYKIKGGEPQ